MILGVCEKHMAPSILMVFEYAKRGWLAVKFV